MQYDMRRAGLTHVRHQMEVFRIRTDAVIVGGGGAGCRAAIEAAERGDDFDQM